MPMTDNNVNSYVIGRKLNVLWRKNDVFRPDFEVIILSGQSRQAKIVGDIFFGSVSQILFYMSLTSDLWGLLDIGQRSVNG